MKQMYYKRDGTPYPDDNPVKWAIDSKNQDGRVAEDILPDGKRISTVFLGLNHNWGEGPPLIFETMVFPSETEGNDLDMDRYSTEEQALEGHKEMVKKWTDKVRKGQKKINKRALKEELVDLRMHLANTEIQANKVIGLLPTKYGLPCKVRWHIREADDELCKIAKKMGLDKVDLVKPRRLDYSERINNAK